MYIILEMQTTAGQTAIVTPVTKTDYLEAIAAFHQAAAFAAVSTVETHTIMLFDQRGDVIEKIVFDHTAPTGE